MADDLESAMRERAEKTPFNYYSAMCHQYIVISDSVFESITFTFVRRMYDRSLPSLEIYFVYPNCANYDDATFCNVKSRKS